MAVFGSLEQSCNLKDSYITCIMYEVLNKVYLKKSHMSATLRDESNESK
jgi:hypothetical protein